MPTRVSVPPLRGPQLNPETGDPTRAAWHRQKRIDAATGFVETLIPEYDNLGDVPQNLGEADAGQLIGLRGEFHHLLRWTGFAWEFAPGDPGNGWMVTFIAGQMPVTPGWALCDGTRTTLLRAGGMLDTEEIVTPVTVHSYVRR